MDANNVPQEGNSTLGIHRKAIYAKDADGKIIIVASRGSEVDETVTMQAVDRLKALAEEARKRAATGATSTLEYWMYARRMDVPLLSQTSGIWQWRIRRHFRPEVFAKISTRVLARYADALGLPTDQLKTLP